MTFFFFSNKQENGHAFILRRYDTGAISLTTMFRAAFPNAPDAEERAEIQWVKENYDLSGNNGSTKDPHITRLAGTWVDPQLAIQLGKAYLLGALVDAVVDATPDPNGNYRRSGKAAVPAPPAAVASATTVTTPLAVQSPTTVVPNSQTDAKTLPTPSPTTNPPAKRRKESSPAPSQSTTSSSIKTPLRPSPSLVKSPSTTRRSTRKSPAPSESPFSVGRSAKRGLKKEPSSSSSSSSKVVVTQTPLKHNKWDLKTVDEEVQLVEDGVAGSELMEEDIKEQRKLLEEMKQQQQAGLPRSVAEDESMGDSVETTALTTKKREREDEEQQSLAFDFKEPEREERTIATNRRVGRFYLEPRAKSFAWGVAAFAVGMGAV